MLRPAANGTLPIRRPYNKKRPQYQLYKEISMNLFVKDLPPETQLLVAMGSAVAAGCQPCLERLVGLAKGEELDPAQMRAAVTIGQFVKDQPAQQIKELADSLLGSKLSGGEPGMECGCDTATSSEAPCCA